MSVKLPDKPTLRYKKNIFFLANISNIWSVSTRRYDGLQFSLFIKFRRKGEFLFFTNAVSLPLKFSKKKKNNLNTKHLSNAEATLQTSNVAIALSRVFKTFLLE
jgi:hypothetical protein